MFIQLEIPDANLNVYVIVGTQQISRLIILGQAKHIHADVGEKKYRANY